MAVEIECIVSSPDKKDVCEVLENLSSLINRLEEVEVKMGNINKQSGFYEEFHIGSLLISIISPIVTGLAANAIWSWIQSKNGKLKTEIIEDPKKPVKIEIGTVNIIMSIQDKNE